MRIIYAGLALIIVLVVGSMSGCISGKRDKPQPDVKSIPTMLDDASEKMRQGETQHAVALYDRILSLDPDNITARSNRAVLFSLQNKTAATAIEINQIRQQQAVILQSQLKKSPDSARLLMQFSRNQSSLGKHRRAIESAQKAVKLSPTAQSYFVLANANYHVEDYSSALNNYNKAIELNPNMVEAYLARAVNKQKLGDHNGAELDFNKVNSLHSNDGISND